MNNKQLPTTLQRLKTGVMNKSTLLLIFFFTSSFCITTSCVNTSHSNSEKSSQSNDSLQLEKAWVTDSMITPESVLWAVNKHFFYVSEIGKEAGNGAIGKLGSDGKIVTLKWAKGLHAPKGMGIYKDTLFVADLKQLVLIDIHSGNIIRKIDVPDAVFLNDITIDKDGQVFISDTRKGRIYTYQKGETSVYLQQPETKDANGLLIKGKTLWMLAAGGIYTINRQDKSIQLFSDGVKGGDGITFINDSSLIASRWEGEVFYVNRQGKAQLLLDTKKSGSNTADLNYVPELKLLLIPSFKGQTVNAYKLKYQ